MAPLKITTTGRATKTHPAERALLRLAIKDTGPKPATVASNVQNATARLQNILSTLTPKSATSGGVTPVLKWTMGTPTSSTYMRSESLSKASRYHAVSTSVEIEFVEFKALASLAAQLSRGCFAGGEDAGVSGCFGPGTGLCAWVWEGE
ncbi:hypothetical protein ASPCAL13787 [Aspergillus calidoustus]|uniref:Uncharacterized protein n=1 Tax=Aspergillus calidoustus TaxID=454130 RepID=A0A0U5GFV9_ASPCI|nr:hypothetical protein ASPCAL13787 [Aspergillus calidoustus]